MLESTRQAFTLDVDTALVYQMINQDFAKKFTAYNLLTVLEAACHGEFFSDEEYTLRIEMPKRIALKPMQYVVELTAVAKDYDGNLVGTETFHIEIRALDSALWLDDPIDPDVKYIAYDVNCNYRTISLKDPDALDRYVYSTP